MAIMLDNRRVGFKPFKYQINLKSIFLIQQDLVYIQMFCFKFVSEQ